MNVMSWLYWGLAATLAQMLFEGITQGLKLTRLSLPFIVGTMFTPSRARAKWIGAAQHLVNGVAFALVYVAAFKLTGHQSWWRGGLLGLFQALLVLVVGMSLLPEVHPRMATERAGPTAHKQLEPPGFMAVNYGYGTPVSIILSHVLFGVVIGQFCD